MMNPLDQFQQFVEEHSEALLSRDFRTVQAFHEKWNPDLPRMPDMVAELAMHKARTAAKGLPKEKRRVSRIWLETRGYSGFDDGDLE